MASRPDLGDLDKNHWSLGRGCGRALEGSASHDVEPTFAQWARRELRSRCDAETLKNGRTRCVSTGLVPIPSVPAISSFERPSTSRPNDVEFPRFLRLRMPSIRLALGSSIAGVKCACMSAVVAICERPSVREMTPSSPPSSRSNVV